MTRAFKIVTLLFTVGITLLAWRLEIQSGQLDILRAELGDLSTQLATPPVGTSGKTSDQEDIAARIKQDILEEIGLFPINLIRERSKSFVEMYSYDNKGSSNYGTAGYLGNGYFITVKHGVVALGQEGVENPTRITSVKIRIKNRSIPARLIDAGNAKVDVDSGDWAILKIRENIDLPAINMNLDYNFDFADPIFRLGNDYSKGIVPATGYVGQRLPNNLVSALTDGHPGVSGGGVMNRKGELVGIPVGRMQGDYRFSFILPLRKEMFRKVPHLR